MKFGLAMLGLVLAGCHPGTAADASKCGFGPMSGGLNVEYGALFESPALCLGRDIVVVGEFVDEAPRGPLPVKTIIVHGVERDEKPPRFPE